MEEEVAFVKRQIWEQLYSTSKNSESNTGEFRIKIRWKTSEDDTTNGSYNYDNLHNMFSKVRYHIEFSTLHICFTRDAYYYFLFKYGNVAALVVSSKKGRAMVEFGDRSAAVSIQVFRDKII